MTIAIALTRTVDIQDVLAALAERGLAGKAAAEGLGVVVEADDPAVIGRLLDAWAGERGLPFMPVQVNPTSYALVPPAG